MPAGATAAVTTGSLFVPSQINCERAQLSTFDTSAARPEGNRRPAAGDVDLFGWSTAATEYGISTSTSVSDYSGDFVDWGKNIGDGSTWRTLSKDEWVYLLMQIPQSAGALMRAVASLQRGVYVVSLL